jgi:uncharacterized protein YecT (DUF1311 family)
MEQDLGRYLGKRIELEGIFGMGWCGGQASGCRLIPMVAKFTLIAQLFLVGWLCALSTGAEKGGKELTEAEAAYEEADRALNREYQRAREVLFERAFEELREKQRRWIDYRDYHCGEVLRHNSLALANADLLQRVEYWERMSEITRERTAILRSIVAAHEGDTPPLGGIWIDGYGASLSIVELDGRIAFEIDVVRGPTFHLGNIIGYAAVNGTLARFDDGGEDDGKGDVRKAAWLTFIRRHRTDQCQRTALLWSEGLF